MKTLLVLVVTLVLSGVAHADPFVVTNDGAAFTCGGVSGPLDCFGMLQSNSSVLAVLADVVTETVPGVFVVSNVRLLENNVDETDLGDGTLTKLADGTYELTASANGVSLLQYFVLERVSGSGRGAPARWEWADRFGGSITIQ